MTFTLESQGVSDLIAFVDRNVRERGCDHSLRFSEAWAKQRSINWDDLLDVLEAKGAFCDCEVVLNLDDGPLTCTSEVRQTDRENRWLLPQHFCRPGRSDE